MNRKWITITLATAMVSATFQIQGAFAEVSSATRQKVEQIRQQKQQYLNQKSQISADISKQQAVMQQAKKKIEEIQKEMDPIEQQYLQALDKEKAVENEFKNRLRSLYLQGETHYLAQLLSADSFNQFLKRFEVVRLIAEQDYQLLEKHRQAVEEVEKKKAVYDKKIAEQNQYIAQANKAYQEAMARLKAINSSLSQVQAMEGDYEDAIIDINLQEWRDGKLHFAWTGPLQKPVHGPITSTFGYRYHPIFHQMMLHEGIDFGAPIGTPIYAAADGVVVSSRPSYGYGWLITIYHGDYNGKPFFTRYAHSYPNQVLVKVGQEVKAGQQISSIGNNGNSTGPHLHFEVRIGYGEKPPAIDPMKFLQQ
jgi:murein DD-endopeptidase MepM/ murein hydrolase activator NlpD